MPLGIYPQGAPFTLGGKPMAPTDLWDTDLWDTESWDTEPWAFARCRPVGPAVPLGIYPQGAPFTLGGRPMALGIRSLLPPLLAPKVCPSPWGVHAWMTLGERRGGAACGAPAMLRTPTPLYMHFETFLGC